MYILVEFEENNSTNIVPEIWYQDGMARWPNYKNDKKINQAIEKKEQPGADWSCHVARVLAKAATYQEARKKMNQSITCCTSELQSEEEDESLLRKKRKRQRSVRLHDYHEEDEELNEECSHRNRPPLPVPPTLPPPTITAVSKSAWENPSFSRETHERPCTQVENSESGSLVREAPVSYREMLNDQVWEPLPTYSAPRPVSQNKDVWRAAVSFREKTGEPPSVETSRPAHECAEWGTPFRAPRPASQDRGSWRAAVNYREKTAEPPSVETSRPAHECAEWGTPFRAPRPASQDRGSWRAAVNYREKTAEPPSVETSRPAHECAEWGTPFRETEAFSRSQFTFTGHSGQIPCTAAEFHLLTQLESLRQQQVQQTLAINSILTLLQGNQSPSRAEMPKEFLYPLKDLNELERQEIWLQDAGHSAAKANMISYLGTIGGKDLKATVWNILTRLLDNSVAKKVNWKGINSKRSFRDMDLKTVILSAVRKNPLNEKASDVDIERHIIRWFNLSGDRAGGRKNREKYHNM
uniref:Uncharacterized LOC111197441 n=1 Tax=Astyanax mexicanus TaxID=7994 RepID=A0A3B1IEL9_ASTMX